MRMLSGEFVNHWNCHLIAKIRVSPLTRGRPNSLYCLPQLYESETFHKDVNLEKLEEFKDVPFIKEIAHPETRRPGDVVATSLCTYQWRHSYIPNETPNDISVERRQDVSMVLLHDVLLVCRDDVSWGRNDDVPSIRLHDVSNKSQMKHPMTSQWYVSTTSH